MQDVPGYEFIRELGRGGMAVVYLATQKSLKRPVALKLLDRNVPGYSELAQRFINEAHTLAGLRHRNIVTVYDVVASSQGDFISMEYLEDGSLADRLAVGLSVQQSLSILAQLGSALDAAHARGIVHRDIKPDNVLFRDPETPVLTDFGIARLIDPESQRMTQAGLAVGTPSYMSPEQISGDPIDGRADQYSLGAMWFQMLTGDLPYKADNTSDLLVAHLARPIPSLPASLSALQPVIDRMLAKQPAARYSNLAAMLVDVGRHLLRAPELLRAPPGAAQVSPTERLHQLGFPTTGVQQTLSTSQTRLLDTPRELSQPNLPVLKGSRFRVVVMAVVVAALALAVGGLLYRDRSATAPAESADSTTAPASVPADSAALAGDTTSARSIAVLPFADLSQEKDQAYMSDGLAEELLNLLTKVPRLRVIARTSSFSFKDKAVDVATIAKALDVDHVLQGSVRRSGNRLRISAQLIRAQDSAQVWSETYDRDDADVFAVQDEIAAAVVGQLKIKLMGEPPHTQKTDAQAYALFLKARQAGRRGDAQGLENAVTLYRQALDIDPAYAPAWVGLSSNYANQANSGLRPMDEGFRLAREAVDKALEIDPDFARAHAQMGYIAMSHIGDLQLAASHLERALVLAPDDTGVILNAARLAQALARVDQATAFDQLVIARDPVNARAHYNLGVDYLYSGREDEAIASWQTTLALSPDFIGAWYNIGTAYLLRGQNQSALASFQKEPSEVWRLIGLPMAYHALGKKAESDAALAKLTAEHANDSAYNIAYVHGFRGENDLAFQWLDKAIAYKDTGLSDIAFEPAFTGMRKDPRWAQVLRKLGKSPEQLAAVKFDVKLPE
ncbi:MAG: protein kinase [Gammaproteobacteria bacterium]|nr:protein kinase [Gammaproteobacteria bacterium]